MWAKKAITNPRYSWSAFLWDSGKAIVSTGVGMLSAAGTYWAQQPEWAWDITSASVPPVLVYILTLIEYTKSRATVDEESGLLHDTDYDAADKIGHTHICSSFSKFATHLMKAIPIPATAGMGTAFLLKYVAGLSGLIVNLPIALTATLVATYLMREAKLDDNQRTDMIYQGIMEGRKRQSAPRGPSGFRALLEESLDNSNGSTPQSSPTRRQPTAS